MIIHNITIRNFKSCYGEHYFDFDTLNGLVKLSGPIGAGKTLVGEALLCGLFGKIKDHTNPNLVAWGTDTWELEMNLTSKGNEIHLIRNPKKQLLVEVDGKLLSATGKNDMQSTLEEYYDVPRLAIEKMCIMSFSNFNSLAALTPYETKCFLDDVFGFQAFTDYNDRTIIEKKNMQTQLSELQTILSEAERQIIELNKKREEQKEKLANKIDVNGLQNQRELLVNQGTELKQSLIEIQNKYNNQLREFDEKIRQLENKKTEAATLGKVQKDNYNKFKEGKCPTCGHEIDQSVINSYKQKMESYAADWKQYDADIKKIQEKKSQVYSEMLQETSSINQEMNKLRGDISSIDFKVREYESGLKLITQNYDELISSQEKKAKQTREDIVKCDVEVSEWGELSDLFTKTLRYNLLDKLIPHINANIQYYMTKLEQGYIVKFDQEFKPHIYSDNFGAEISYKDLSTGQRKTLDLAIIFGIMQNIISNVNFNIFFLDELMSNMDANSRDTMISTLKDTLSDGRTIFVINHAEMGDDLFNHKIRVSLHNKNTKLSKKKLKAAVNTGSDEIIARATHYEFVF